MPPHFPGKYLRAAHARALVLLTLLGMSFSRGTAQDTSRVEVMDGAPARAAHERLRALVGRGYSGAVIVEKDGIVRLEAGYGWANREKRIPFTSSTVAQIGSLTKAFTAAAAVQLWNQGKLSFSDSIAKYFPDVPSHAANITLHQLLTHTSGLRDNCGSDFGRTSRQELMRDCLAPPLDRPPGSALVYSNLGYSVVAAIVEKVSGQPFEDYLSRQLLKPLELSRTGYAIPKLARDSFALGYSHDSLRGNILDSLQPLGTDFWRLKGNGGMQASVRDMYRWYKAFRDPNGVITDRMKKAILAPQALRSDSVFYGYGWFVRVNGAGELQQVSHSGSDGVFHSAILWRPADRLFIYTVTNAGENDMTAGIAGTLWSYWRTP